MNILPLIKLFHLRPTDRLPRGAYGVGIYPTLDHGTVWRWDGGLRHKPTTIHWSKPDCGHDHV